MTIIANTPHTDTYETRKEQVTRTFWAMAAQAGKRFWSFTEETGETTSASFKGLL